MPLAAGARRIYSEPEDSFWCCVGSGMESHAKHADSIFWADDRTLYVNLYIPSELAWTEKGIGLSLETAMPFAGSVQLALSKAPRRRQAIALRIPSWAKGAQIKLNGLPIPLEARDGYAVIDRRWDAGDVLDLELPMALGVEHVPDDPSLVAFTHGPLVMAADLGPADADFAGLGPALVSPGNPREALRWVASAAPAYAATGALGEELELHPFFNRYDRRSAVYFPTFSSSEWLAAKPGYIRAQEADRLLARRTVDTIHLGEMQPERDHRFVSGRSEVVNWNGRAARRLPPGDSVEMTLACKPGPAVLRITIWSADAGRRFEIAVDGDRIEGDWPAVEPGEGFVGLDFPLPNAGEQGRGEAVVRITALKDHALIYSARMLTADEA